MDVYDTALTSGAGRDESGTEQAAAQAQRPPQPSGEHAQEGASSSSSQEAPKTENLQDEVQQLVGSMSSWWKGVSKQVRPHRYFVMVCRDVPRSVLTPCLASCGRAPLASLKQP